MDSNTFKDSIFEATARTNTASVMNEPMSRNMKRANVKSQGTHKRIKNQLDSFLAYDSIQEGHPSCNYSNFAKLLLSGNKKNLKMPVLNKKPPKKEDLFLQKPMSPSIMFRRTLVNIKDESSEQRKMRDST